MQKTKTNKKPEGGSKKKARKGIEKKLEVALASLVPVLGEKKFRKRIRKAGKILSQGLNGAADSSIKKTKTKAVAGQSDQQL